MSQGRLQDYYNNLAFYEGYQWQSWNAKTLAFNRSPIEDDSTQRVYLVNNLIRPLADTRIAKITSEKPTLQVVSTLKTAKAINQAEFETKILKAIWREVNIPSLLLSAIKWSVITNHSFLRPYFDPEAGLAIANPEYDEAEAEVLGDEYNQVPYFQMGKLNVDLFTPFEVMFDTSQRTWRNVMQYGWVLIKTVKSRDSLESTFGPEKLKDIKYDPKAASTTVEEQMLMLSSWDTYQARVKDKRRDQEFRNMEVYEYYEAPNASNDYKGLHVIKCGDKVLYDSRETGESFRRIPVIMIHDQIGVETLWGRSLVSGSRQKQKQYNILLSKLVELSRLPVGYLVPEGCGLDEQSIPGRSYFVSKFDPEGGTPVMLQPAPPNQTWLALIAKIEQDLEHYWGTHEVTARSQPPSKGMSGRSLYLLQGADTTRFSSTMTLLSDMLSDLGEILLDLAKEHYREKRSMVFFGEGGREYQIEFTGIQDISGKNSVHIEMGSEFSRNKEALQQLVINFLGVVGNIPAVAQVINDPIVMHKVFSFIDEEFANIFLSRNQDMEVQERENRELLDGDSPKVRPWDKHNVHIAVMINMMNSEEFRKLDDGEQERIVQSHFVPHVQAMMGQRNAQMQEQMAMQQPGGPNAQFQQAAQGKGPLEQIDETIENKVMPQPGAYGTENMGF